jgi:hypothetical protein
VSDQDLSWTRRALAKLCGAYLILEPEDTAIVDFNKWRPDEDVSQAMRCLAYACASTGSFIIDVNKAVIKITMNYDGKAHKTKEESLPRAIVLALIDALGLKKGE